MINFIGMTVFFIVLIYAICRLIRFLAERMTT